MTNEQQQEPTPEPESPVDRKERDIVANREAGLISAEQEAQQLGDLGRYRDEGPRGHYQAPERRPADEGVSPDDPEGPTSVDSQNEPEGEGAPDSDGGEDPAQDGGEGEQG